MPKDDSTKNRKDAIEQAKKRARPVSPGDDDVATEDTFAGVTYEQLLKAKPPAPIELSGQHNTDKQNILALFHGDGVAAALRYRALAIAIGAEHVGDWPVEGFDLEHSHTSLLKCDALGDRGRFIRTKEKLLLYETGKIRNVGGKQKFVGRRWHYLGDVLALRNHAQHFDYKLTQNMHVPWTRRLAYRAGLLHIELTRMRTPSATFADKLRAVDKTFLQDVVTWCHGLGLLNDLSGGFRSHSLCTSEFAASWNWPSLKKRWNWNQQQELNERMYYCASSAIDSGLVECRKEVNHWKNLCNVYRLAPLKEGDAGVVAIDWLKKTTLGNRK